MTMPEAVGDRQAGLEGGDLGGEVGHLPENRRWGVASCHFMRFGGRRRV
jgi:hypothetical protein